MNPLRRPQKTNLPKKTRSEISTAPLVGRCQAVRRVVSEDDNEARIHTSNHNVMQRGFEGLLTLILLG